MDFAYELPLCSGNHQVSKLKKPVHPTLSQMERGKEGSDLLMKFSSAVCTLMATTTLGLSATIFLHTSPVQASYYTTRIPKRFHHKWYGNSHRVYNRLAAKYELYHAPGINYISSVTRVKVYSAKHIRVWTNNQAPSTFKIKGHRLAALEHGKWSYWSR